MLTAEKIAHVTREARKPAPGHRSHAPDGKAGSPAALPVAAAVASLRPAPNAPSPVPGAACGHCKTPARVRLDVQLDAQHCARICVQCWRLWVAGEIDL